MDKSFLQTIKEAGFADAVFMKMDAVALQGVWPTTVYGEVAAVAGGHAPKIGAMYAYLLEEERRRGRRMKGKEIIDHARRNREKLDETIKRFEIREVTELVLFLDGV